MKSVLVSAAAAPTPVLEKQGPALVVTNQNISWASYGAAGLVAVASWLLMLVLAFHGTVVRRTTTPLVAALGAFILGQVVLHSIYGEISFLYAADYFIVLVLLASLGALGKWPSLFRAAAICFIVAGAYSNNRAFLAAVDLARTSLGA